MSSHTGADKALPDHHAGLLTESPAPVIGGSADGSRAANDNSRRLEVNLETLDLQMGVSGYVARSATLPGLSPLALVKFSTPSGERFVRADMDKRAFLDSVGVEFPEPNVSALFKRLTASRWRLYATLADQG
jgi:hypothetical protein